MMSVHLVLGVVWLGVLALYVRRPSSARGKMMICAVLGLWYLPFGTVLSVAQLFILWLGRLREREFAASEE